MNKKSILQAMKLHLQFYYGLFGKKGGGAAFLLILSLAFTACADTQISTSATPNLLIPTATRVDTAVVTRGTVAEAQRFVGIVRQESIPLNFGAIAANLGEFYVRPGDSVVQGQVLARLDADLIEEQIVQQEERLSRLIYEFNVERTIRELDIEIMALELRDILFNAAETMNTSAFVAAERRELEIERAKLDLELIKERQSMTLRQEEVQLRNLVSRRAELNLYAPFDGVITRVVNRGWVPSFTDILYISPMDAEVFVEYLGAAIFAPNRAVRIQGQYQGQVFGLNRMFLTREQILYYRNLNINMPVRFAIESDDIPPVGSLVTIYVYSHFLEDTLRIPRNALLASPEYGFFVYGVNDGILTQVLITVSAVTSTYVAVVSGLAEGDVIYVR